MLVLSRRVGEIIVIGTGKNQIKIRVQGITTSTSVSLGITAPRYMKVSKPQYKRNESEKKGRHYYYKK